MQDSPNPLPETQTDSVQVQLPRAPSGFTETISI